MKPLELNNAKEPCQDAASSVERGGKTQGHRRSPPKRSQCQRSLSSSSDRTGTVLHVGKAGQSRSAGRTTSKRKQTKTGRSGKGGPQGGTRADACSDCRDQCGEYRDKKKDLQITKHRRYSASEKQEILAAIVSHCQRNRCSVRSAIDRMGISVGTYYNWKSRQASGHLSDQCPGRPRAIYSSTPSEEQAVVTEARYRTLGYKSLAWLMVNEKIVYLRPHQVYRILQEHRLLQYQRPRHAALTRPCNQRRPMKFGTLT